MLQYSERPKPAVLPCLLSFRSPPHGGQLACAASGRWQLPPAPRPSPRLNTRRRVALACLPLKKHRAIVADSLCAYVPYSGSQGRLDVLGASFVCEQPPPIASLLPLYVYGLSSLFAAGSSLRSSTATHTYVPFWRPHATASVLRIHGQSGFLLLQRL